MYDSNCVLTVALSALSSIAGIILCMCQVNERRCNTISLWLDTDTEWSLFNIDFFIDSCILLVSMKMFIVKYLTCLICSIISQRSIYHIYHLFSVLLSSLWGVCSEYSLLYIYCDPVKHDMNCRTQTTKIKPWELFQCYDTIIGRQSYDSHIYVNCHTAARFHLNIESDPELTKAPHISSSKCGVYVVSTWEKSTMSYQECIVLWLIWTAQDHWYGLIQVTMDCMGCYWGSLVMRLPPSVSSPSVMEYVDRESNAHTGEIRADHLGVINLHTDSFQ